MTDLIIPDYDDMPENDEAEMLDLDALRDALVSRNVLDAADLPTPPDRPRPRPRTGA